MIVIISPTHAPFTSLLRTLAYMFRPLRAIIRASQITKGYRLKCASMNKILEFYKNEWLKYFKMLLKFSLLLVSVVLCVYCLFVVFIFIKFGPVACGAC
jgi:hypothetical protein